jgi:hypothetical protein
VESLSDEQFDSQRFKRITKSGVALRNTNGETKRIKTDCDMTASRGLTSDALEFGRNAAASSKDNFVAWMVTQLGEFGERFDWNDQEMEAIVGMLLIARDMAIEDVDSALGDIERFG